MSMKYSVFFTCVGLLMNVHIFQGSLQVWAYSGAESIKSDAKKIGISSDEHNIAPSHLDILLTMDMSHGDFVFQQGEDFWKKGSE